MKLVKKFFGLLFLIQFICSGQIIAQEKSTIRVDLSYHQLNNKLPALTALIRTRVDRRYQPVEQLKVNFYFNEINDSNFLGSSETDLDGKATIQLQDEFSTIWDTTYQFTFIAAVKDDPNYEDNDDEIEIWKGEMTMELLEGDEKEVKVTISKYSDEGNLVPAPEVYVKLQVKRMFGTLPVGDDSYETDEEGTFTASFPDDIPGGTEGILTIIAFVEDDDDLGYLKLEKESDWGTRVVDEKDPFGGRSLWASRDKAPIWLLIFPNLIILSIWGTMIYLVMLIFRIRKLGRSS